MTVAPIVVLPISVEVFDKLNSLKRSRKFRELSDNDILLYMIDHILPELGDEGRVRGDRAIAPSVYCKQEEEVKVRSNGEGDTERLRMIKCETFEQYDTQPRIAAQYTCDCGQSYDNLQAFIRHNFNCSHEKPRVKTEPRKHSSPFDVGNEETPKKSKLSEFNCDICNRQFRTASAIYTHGCRRSPIEPALNLEVASGDERKLSMPVPEASSHSSGGRASPETAEPVCLDVKIENKLICSCNKTFTKEEYYAFVTHEKQCGRQNASDRSLSTFSTKSSPLKVMPNEEGKFVCSECSKSFASILSLKQHRDGLHRQGPKYSCQKCGKGYRWCTSFHYHKKKCTA